MVDGGCPVIREGSPCPDKPLPAALTVTRAGSTDVVATAISGEDGRFRIPLAPGRYVVLAANVTGAIRPAASPVDVEVPTGRYVSITVSFDSGIR
jgi:hypothetical protein